MSVAETPYAPAAVARSALQPLPVLKGWAVRR